MPVETAISGIEFTELRFRPQLTGVGVSLSWLVSSPDGVEMRLCSLHGGEWVIEAHVLNPVPRTGRGTGGGSYDWTPDGNVVVYVSRDGEICAYEPSSRTGRIVTAIDGCQIFGICASESFIAAVVDEREVIVFEIATGKMQRVDDSQDFAFDPVWFGTELVWTAWNIPNMPWEASGVRIWGGAKPKWLLKPRDHQVQQVRPITPSTLGCVSDASGWMNVSKIKRRKLRCSTIEPIVKEKLEHAGPTWGMGERTWAASDEKVFYTRNTDGFGQLVMTNSSGNETVVGNGVHHSICAQGNFVAALRSGARTPTQVIIYDVSESERTILDSVGDFSQFEQSMVEPEIIEVPAEGFSITTRLFKPRNPNGRLLVWVHGGPTDQWRVTWYPKFIYWLSRGYSVAVPDHRGTTGHGRAFQQSLLGHWGEFDSDDIAATIRWLIVNRHFQSRDIALIGGSAGGFTALNVVAENESLVACVAVSYPVTDLAHLAATSHRFEKHSVYSLVGSPGLFATRSPINKASQISRTPALIMHGDLDPVVPIEQGRNLAKQLKDNGGDVHFEVMAGEGHGFRNPENKKREYLLMEEFFDRHLAG